MLITNLRVVLADAVIEGGALLLEGGRIAGVYAGDAPRHTGRRVNGVGLTAIPGIIDLHGDMLEREIEPRPGSFFPVDMAVHELDKRLAAAGVTTAYAALSFWDVDRPESVRGEAMVQQVVRELGRMRPDLLTDLRIHARFEVSTPTVAPLLAELIEAGQIQMLSLMDHTPGQGQYRNIEQYISFMAKWRRVDPGHIEEELRERLAKAGDLMGRWGIARDIAALARDMGLPIASHDDDTLEKVDLVSSLGATISEFPVTLEAAQEARRRDMHVIMGGPNALRGGSHSGNISAREAIDAGVVDALAADYHPATLVQAAFGLAASGALGLPAAVALVSAGPAAALGLDDRGRIAEGLSADLALVEDGPRPRVRAAIRAGVPIYWDAAMAGR
ncbi:alpha-D-ribose 1-methylphosphonate 5-triphosphate diphosphatase [Oscillochloris sp. ZM17-4]|uniref:alpha-D-ribose 1-methylphosphonate 5-triphosphate diphosphatase n=1 Tax=Oscillochloris sp. ZM17-4 TaxID=2866714 RepID=UPI001C731B8D|nr:alpha-D-ribose 1-methylphosphonate 5-triphosphate diphosphatase [Oscillochloris sp. ZM17-4]MBX0329392.1 alpha-D-ribose 1-methylphosphonate 5-triphosphate diphosphatase [Oscillochloris sp. ZM17-4]